LRFFSDLSMDQDINHIGVHLSNHFEKEVVDDFIYNHIIKVDHNQNLLNHVIPSSYDHFYEEETIICDDQELLLKYQGGHLFFSKGECIHEKSFFPNQYDCDLSFEDLVVALLESYLSDSFKFSYFIISLALVGENDFLKGFLWLRLCFCYHLLISGRKGILSVMKLLVWFHWKHDFTQANNIQFIRVGVCMNKLSI